MKQEKILKPFPRLLSDEEAEDFVANSDLTEYDWSDMKRVHFEFTNKDARVNMRLPANLLSAVKAHAAAQKMPYQRFIRSVLERAVAG
jgi:predicted DNA binding CopG/RHH family protein